MARTKWIFSCFLILGTLRSLEASAINMTHIHNMTTTAQSQGKEVTNLTSITWAHAVNSQKELEEALNSNVHMIEADIVLGKLINDTNGTDIPVMGHPPANTSDISLNEFLNKILEHNKNHTNNIKGVKLDFKSTEVFKGSLDLLHKLWHLMAYPIWLNADIIEGPVNETTVIPVDPVEFFAGCKEFKTAILSIGWTTRWGHNYTEGSYSENHINKMIQSIKENNITNTKHKITFPVRAGIAAHSLPQLRDLFNALNKTNGLTLTIWSSKNDNVDIKKLRNLIFSFGLDKVYLDVPEEVSSRLELDKGNNSATSSLANFSIISLCMWLTSIVLQRSQL